MAGWRGFGAIWVLRRVLRAQERQNQLLARVVDAVQAIAAAQRIQAQATLGEQPSAGFRTGMPDGKDEAGLVRTSDAELADLLQIEFDLTRQLGRAPTSDEVVGRYEELKAGGVL